MKNKYALLGLMLTFVIFSLASVSACSCIPTKSVAEEVEGSDLVFEGRVTEIKTNSIMDYNYDVKFEVRAVWKGEGEEYITIKTGQDSAMCGYPFEVNQVYLVYANEFEGEMSVSLCGRTAPLYDSNLTQNEDMEKLGAPNQTYCAGRCGVTKVSFFGMIKAWFTKLFD